MKRIQLNFKDRPDARPFTLTVATESESEIVGRTSFESPGRTSSFAKLPDGTILNQYGVALVRVKADRRPKPYSVRYDGIDGTATRKFATLAEVQQYVKGRWQGTDYIDGRDGFHNDYGSFTLQGCLLSDLGSRPADDQWGWGWKAL